MEPRSDAERGGKEINLEYYLRSAPGRADYWRWMAAPRFRVRTLLALLREIGPASLADLGCGSGELLEEVRRAFPSCRLCGLDLSPRQIEANRRRMPGVAWRVADLDREEAIPPELAGGFDAVIASEIIEHVPSPERFLRNARRLARAPGGVLLLSTQSGPLRETERRVGHLRHFSVGEMRALFEASGWSPARIWNSGWPFHDLSKWMANLDPDRTFRRFSDEPYTWGQRSICLALRIAFRFNCGKKGAQLFAVGRCEAAEGI